ncbi:putative ATPase/DNA-binding CsgD family transcriptional regulator/Tfp pilus assembly protein PilF [Mycobacterium sp. MAA66]|uniref:ATP-binding protein n=1 Tax=Mycobacterium sp. MAA66 TaxID=3156297 RepID=UPI0035157D59
MQHPDGWPFVGCSPPADITPLVGREAERKELRHLLTAARLITLTGVGGVGKTRLAAGVARTVGTHFPDGVAFVSLAELTEPELLPQLVSTAMAAPPAESADAVSDFIGERSMLLVLDNLEHLSDASARLAATLLNRCAHLRILATSREALRIHGETVFQVNPLAVPNLDGHGPPGWTARYPAVTLFVDRATALNASFTLNDQNERAIAELCRRLDGVPLALELAASASRWLPIEVIASMASEPLAMPPWESRATEPRHLSLRATLDYSRTLCGPEAQTLWGRLSVFKGGASLQAIERVCVDERLTSASFQAALVELIEKSLVAFDAARYRMLETVRQYGAELLRGSAMESQARQSHLAVMGDLAARVSESWFSWEQQRLFDAVRDDLANIRAALEFALQEPGQAAAGLRLATDLWSFWVGCGLPSEGRLWIDRFLTLPDIVGSDHCESFWATGYLAAIDGDFDTAQRHLRRALKISVETGDLALQARATQALGIVALFNGRHADALACYEEGIALQRVFDPEGPHLADGLILLGEALCDLGELDRATKILDEARSLCQVRDEQLLRSWSDIFLALVALKQAQFDDARRNLRKAVSTQAGLGNWQGIVWAVEVSAWAELAIGNIHHAAQLFGASEAVSAGHGPHLHGAWPMIAQRSEQLEKARQALGTDEFEEQVSQGRSLILAEVVELVSGGRPVGRPEFPLVAGKLQLLTPREREIAELVARGMRNRDIAAQLVIARRTVDSHVEHILAKLEFSSRTQIAALVAETKRV